jgi:hypothetical protein
MVYDECIRCGAQMAFYSEGAKRGFEAENARRVTAGRAPFLRVCDPCRTLERKPQGETVKLFEPAPNQMPGQLSF